MDVLMILITILIGVLSVYWWYIATYFKRMNIPYCTPLPIVGNFLSVLIRKKTFVDVLQEYYDHWPDAKYFGIFNFTQPIIVIRDPDLIKTVTVKHFDHFMNHQNMFDDNIEPLLSKSLVALKGDKWRSVRNMLTPAFTSSKMKMMFDLMSNCAQNFSEYLVNEVKNEGIFLEIDIKEAITKYTNDVIASCACGIQVDSMKNPENEFYTFGRQLSTFSNSSLIKSFIIYFFPKLSKIIGLRLLDQKLVNFFNNTIEETIRHRLQNKIHRPDMIQLMLDAKDNVNGMKNIDIEEMTAQVFIFFFGGFITSATLTSFASMEIATNSEVQSKLQAEIDIVLKQTNGNPTYDVINDMPYLEAVLYETLRFYPNTPILDRVCTNTFELPSSLEGYEPVTVNTGSNIWIAAGGIHNDSKYYDEPGIFNPDRFLNKKININQSTFLAFGIGPRSCIGSRFAILENKLILFHLLARCNLKPTKNTPIPLKFNKSTFEITFENGYKLNLEIRKHSYFGSGL